MLDSIMQWVSGVTVFEFSRLIVAIPVTLFVLYCLWWLAVEALDSFVNRRLVELYKQKDNLWLGVNDAYDNYEDLSEKVWDYEETKFKLKVAMKDIEALEEFLLGEYEPIRDENIKGVYKTYTLDDITYGKYLYDKVNDEICHVIGWGVGANENRLQLRYESNNWEKVSSVNISNLKEFRNRFYVIQPEERNSAGYVKEYIQEHLGITDK